MSKKLAEFFSSANEVIDCSICGDEIKRGIMIKHLKECRQSLRRSSDFVEIDIASEHPIRPIKRSRQSSNVSNEDIPSPFKQVNVSQPIQTPNKICYDEGADDVIAPSTSRTIFSPDVTDACDSIDEPLLERVRKQMAAKHGENSAEILLLDTTYLNQADMKLSMASSIKKRPNQLIERDKKQVKTATFNSNVRKKKISDTDDRYQEEKRVKQHFDVHYEEDLILEDSNEPFSIEAPKKEPPGRTLQFNSKLFLDNFMKFIWPVAIDRLDTEIFDTEPISTDLIEQNDKLPHQLPNGTISTLIGRFEQLNDNEKFISLALFCRQPTKWIDISKLPYLDQESTLNVIRKLVNEEFLVDVSKSKMTINELLLLMSAPHLQKVAKIYKLFKQGQTKNQIIEALVIESKQKTLFGQPKEKIMRNQIGNILSNTVRMSWPAYYLFSILFIHYAPDMVAVPAEDKLNLRWLSWQITEAEKAESIGVCHKYLLPASLIEIPSKFNLMQGLSFYDLIYAIRLEEEINRLTKGAKFSAIVAKEDILLKFYIRVAKYCNYDKPCLYTNIEPHLRSVVCAYKYLARACFQMCSAHERLKQHDMAQKILHLLVDQRRTASYPGAWYERLAINYQHLKENFKAIRICRQAITMKSVKKHTAMTMGDRYSRLTAKIADPEGNLFDNESIADLCAFPEEPVKYEFTAPTIGKHGQGDGAHNIFEGGGVEEVAKKHYLEMTNENKAPLFTHGTHTETIVWSCLYATVLWDCVYAKHRDDRAYIWFHRLQSKPLDFFAPYMEGNDFDSAPSYIRSGAFEQQLEKIEVMNGDHLREFIAAQHEKHQYKISEMAGGAIATTCPIDGDQLATIAWCLGGRRLAKFLRYRMEDYAHRRSGMPDLLLWNEQTGYIRAVEVKGPGDTLRVKQRLWLDWFKNNDIDAEVCYVKAISNRAL